MPKNTLFNNIHKKLTWEEERHKALLALSNAFAIASAGIAALRTIESVLPLAARNVENASRDLSDSFMILTENLQHQNSANHSAVSEAIKNVTMSMQFQDRNTQISENAVLIMEKCRSLLEDVQKNIGTLFEQQSNNDAQITSAVDTILSAVRLSDMRNSFKETLNDMRINYNEDTIAADQAANDVELF